MVGLRLISTESYVRTNFYLPVSASLLVTLSEERGGQQCQFLTTSPSGRPARLNNQGIDMNVLQKLSTLVLVVALALTWPSSVDGPLGATPASAHPVRDCDLEFNRRVDDVKRLTKLWWLEAVKACKVVEHTHGGAGWGSALKTVKEQAEVVRAAERAAGSGPALGTRREAATTSSSGNSVAAEPWTNGFTDEAVVVVQSLLDQAGYPVEVDGVWGPESDGAVRAFQVDKGLFVDGIPGRITLGELRAEVR